MTSLGRCWASGEARGGTGSPGTGGWDAAVGLDERDVGPLVLSQVNRRRRSTRKLR
jgi:hypothetical protein